MAVVLLSFGWLIAFCWGAAPFANTLGPWTYAVTFGGLAGGVALIEGYRSTH